MPFIKGAPLLINQFYDNVTTLQNVVLWTSFSNCKLA